MGKKRGARPFHETIVDAINGATQENMWTILTLIKATSIPKNHDVIIEAINRRRKELGLLKASGIINHLRKQQALAEKSSK